MLDPSGVALWLLLALAVYFFLSWFVIKLQNQYSEQFHQTKISIRQSIASLAITAICLSVLCWLARARLPGECFLSLAIAAASLRGVYLIDRQLLIIPDRLQLLGLGGGILFLLCLVLSGEDPQAVLLEVGFALLMVVFLWILSHLYLRLRQSVGFGMGDIKLLGWLSLFVGKRMADVILMSIACGLFYLLIMAARNSFKQKKLVLPKGQEAFAFGPSIVIGVVAESMFHYA